MISSCINGSYSLPQPGLKWKRKTQPRISTRTAAIPFRTSKIGAYSGTNEISSLTSTRNKKKISHIRRNESLIEKEYYDIKEEADDYFGLKEMISPIITPILPILNIVYRFCRPYALLFNASATISTSLLPILSLSDLSPMYILAVLQATVAMMLGIVFVNGVNALTDIEIDKINMPKHAPIASDELSPQAALTMTILSAVMSISMAAISQSPALLFSVLANILVGGIAYSIDLPFLRWKKSPLMAAVTCLIMSFAGNIPLFIHFQKYVLGKPLVFTKSIIFGAAFSAVFMIITSLLKDIPDVEGDKANGIKTLAVRIGKEKVFNIVFYTLLALFGASIGFGMSLPSLLNRYVMVLGNLYCTYLLVDSARSVDLSNNDTTTSFRLLTWQLAFMENFLIPFVH